MVWGTTYYSRKGVGTAEATVLTASTASKQEEMKAGAQLPPYFLFSVGLHPVDPSCPHSGASFLLS